MTALKMNSISLHCCDLKMSYLHDAMEIDFPQELGLNLSKEAHMKHVRVVLTELAVTCLAACPALVLKL